MSTPSGENKLSPEWEAEIKRIVREVLAEEHAANRVRPDIARQYPQSPNSPYYPHGPHFPGQPGNKGA